MAPTPVRIGVVGGGLMGRELLLLTRRWDALVDHPASARGGGSGRPGARRAAVVAATPGSRR